MKTLHLHIGFPKTGSSALQSWFSNNADALSRQGIEYADLAPLAKAGEATSGNGYTLYKALLEQDTTQAAQLLRDVYFGDSGNREAIVSCEFLCALSRPKLEPLRGILEQQNIEIHIIAYLRSFYERAYSAHFQDIRHKGRSEALSADDVEELVARTQRNLLKYSRKFDGRMTVLNYDDPQRNIFEAFTQTVGIDASTLEAVEARVNRGFSNEEAKVMRELNTLHDGRFAASLSKFLIRSAPQRPSQTYYDPSVLDQARADARIDLDLINTKFDVTPPVTLDLFELRGANDSGQDNALEIYAQVAEWLLDYAPATDDHTSFKEFFSSTTSLLETRGITSETLAKLNGRMTELEAS